MSIRGFPKISGPNTDRNILWSLLLRLQKRAPNFWKPPYPYIHIWRSVLWERAASSTYQSHPAAFGSASQLSCEVSRGLRLKQESQTRNPEATVTNPKALQPQTPSCSNKKYRGASNMHAFGFGGLEVDLIAGYKGFQLLRGQSEIMKVAPFNLGYDESQLSVSCEGSSPTYSFLHCVYLQCRLFCRRTNTAWLLAANFKISQPSTTQRP